MKKILLLTFSLIALICAYFIWNELSYSPLTQSEAKALFKGFRGNYHKIKSKDLIGLSTHGDYYDIYLYHLENPVIDSSFPQLNAAWENHQPGPNTTIRRWAKCPMDSVALTSNQSLINPLINKPDPWLKAFTRALNNQNNFYSYLYFDEANQYFLLFCPGANTLYYIRKKGI